MFFNFRIFIINKIEYIHDTVKRFIVRAGASWFWNI
jgi:hypothetical protein